ELGQVRSAGKVDVGVIAAAELVGLDAGEADLDAGRQEAGQVSRRLGPAGHRVLTGVAAGEPVGLLASPRVVAQVDVEDDGVAVDHPHHVGVRVDAIHASSIDLAVD